LFTAAPDDILYLQFQFTASALGTTPLSHVFALYSLSPVSELTTTSTSASQLATSCGQVNFLRSLLFKGINVFFGSVIYDVQYLFLACVSQQTSAKLFGVQQV
jgi:hypothetical protein